MDRIGSTEQFDITFVRGRSQAAYYTNFSRLTEELSQRGFADASKRYVIYAGLDRGTTCGESTFGYPRIPGTTYAALYLDSSGCKGSELGQGTVASSGTAETIVAHEWLHADGFVFVTSPRHCPVSLHHVCTAGLYLASSTTGVPDSERADVMFPLSDQKLSQRQLDPGRNDYLDHGIPNAPDLRRSVWLEPA